MQVLLRKRPFEPFRIHLSDGTFHDVRDPRLTLVTGLRMVVGKPNPRDPDSGIGAGYDWVEWNEIARIEPLGAAAPR
jgi:hypothetical protein